MPHDEDPIVRSDDGVGEAFAEIVSRRLSRRELLASGLAAGYALSGGSLLERVLEAGRAPESGLDFLPIKPSTADDIVVAQNYAAQVVVRWGDPLQAGMAPFSADKLTPLYQAHAFGYNNDFLGFMPLPAGSKNSDRGLLAVNFEYVNPELMFPVSDPKELTREQTEVCFEAVGFGVVEIRRTAEGWRPVIDSAYNKRYTATTKMDVSGPAAGSPRMKTSKHADGKSATGTFANCAAGKTPWGTVLSAEENFQSMFGNAGTLIDEQAKRSAARYGVGEKGSEYAWERHFDRFDAAKEPNEANHFGWVVEFDPYDPEWTPVKRTALGRCRHEAATTHVSKNGKVVMYTGDDARFEYVYKFVCAKPDNPRDRKANRSLMDDGTLYVARFSEDGTGAWLPLVFGQGPLTPANGFHNQGDVVIDVRIAADLLGATKMDRPEDIEVNPIDQKVYLVCTNNTDRGKEGKAGPDKMNPRALNAHGHILTLAEAGGDYAATTFEWDIFMVCGDPADPTTYFAGCDKSEVTPISCPDNICFDAAGNLWIATDGQERALKYRDGFYAVPTSGSDRGKLRQFMASVLGSEVCGPEFTPDGRTAFLAIQHPGEDSTFEEPSTHWPDGVGVPRPSVIAIEAKNRDVIGRRGA